jgi:hypothetical protein
MRDERGNLLAHEPALLFNYGYGAISGLFRIQREATEIKAERKDVCCVANKANSWAHGGHLYGFWCGALHHQISDLDLTHRADQTFYYVTVQKIANKISP